MKKLLTLIFPAIIVLSGCVASTVYVPPEQAKEVAPILFAEPSAERTAKVTIVRDKTVIDVSTAVIISENETKIAELQEAEKTTIYLTPGEHVFYNNLTFGDPVGWSIFQLKPNSEITIRLYVIPPAILEMRRIR